MQTLEPALATAFCVRAVESAVHCNWPQAGLLNDASLRANLEALGDELVSEQLETDAKRATRRAPPRAFEVLECSRTFRDADRDVGMWLDLGVRLDVVARVRGVLTLTFRGEFDDLYDGQTCHITHHRDVRGVLRVERAVAVATTGGACTEERAEEPLRFDARYAWDDWSTHTVGSLRTCDSASLAAISTLLVGAPVPSAIGAGLLWRLLCAPAATTRCFDHDELRPGCRDERLGDSGDSLCAVLRRVFPVHALNKEGEETDAAGVELPSDALWSDDGIFGSLLLGANKRDDIHVVPVPWAQCRRMPLPSPEQAVPNRCKGVWVAREKAKHDPGAATHVASHHNDDDDDDDDDDDGDGDDGDQDGDSDDDDGSLESLDDQKLSFR